MNIFEQASRRKLTFSTSVGTLRTDDLWDLPLQHTSRTNLDSIAQSVDKILKDSSTASFVSGAVTDHPNELRLEILKHIIAVKLDAKETAQQAAVIATKRQKLLNALEGKEDEQFKGMSVKEIQKELDKLDK